MIRSLAICTLTLALSARQAAAQADSLDAYIKRSMNAYHIPGLSLAVSRKGAAPVSRAYGLANVEVNGPAAASTVYRIGSISKQFTAAAILSLVDDGRLSLDADAATYLPDIPDVPKGITVRHLLTHTSGVVDFTEIPNSFSEARNDRRPRDVVKPALALPLQFKPGDQYSYSNTNYVLLAMIIERVAGNRNFGVVLRERFFQPLGMTATRTEDRHVIIDQRASGYNWVSGTLVNAEYISPTNSFGSGNLVSTAEDLLKWDAALSSGRVLTPASRAAMFAPAKLNNGQPIKYGLGTELGEHAGHQTVGHQGEVAGFNASLVRYVNDGLTVAVLTNAGDAPSEEIARHVAALYLGLPDATPIRLAPIADNEPATTSRLKGLVLAIANGTPDPANFTEAAQRDLVPNIKRIGREFLGSKGAMTSFVLVARRSEGGRQVYVYRESFRDGPTMLWTFQLAPNGLIHDMEPRLEP